MPDNSPKLTRDVKPKKSYEPPKRQNNIITRYIIVKLLKFFLNKENSLSTMNKSSRQRVTKETEDLNKTVD